MKKFRQIAAMLMLVLLAGCFANLATPRNTSDQLAYAFGSVHAAAASTRVMLANKQITPDKAAQWKSKLDDAEAKLELANTLLDSGNVEGAQARIALANQVLAVVQQELAEQKAKLEKKVTQ